MSSSYLRDAEGVKVRPYGEWVHVLEVDEPKESALLEVVKSEWSKVERELRWGRMMHDDGEHLRCERVVLFHEGGGDYAPVQSLGGKWFAVPRKNVLAVVE
jgi:hypothetical protein